jgi:hypothetical protein
MVISVCILLPPGASAAAAAAAAAAVVATAAAAAAYAAVADFSAASRGVLMRAKHRIFARDKFFRKKSLSGLVAAIFFVSVLSRGI